MAASVYPKVSFAVVGTAPVSLRKVFLPVSSTSSIQHSVFGNQGLSPGSHPCLGRVVDRMFSVG